MKKIKIQRFQIFLFFHSKINSEIPAINYIDCDILR